MHGIESMPESSTQAGINFSLCSKSTAANLEQVLCLKPITERGCKLMEYLRCCVRSGCVTAWPISQERPEFLYLGQELLKLNGSITP